MPEGWVIEPRVGTVLRVAGRPWNGMAAAGTKRKPLQRQRGASGASAGRKKRKVSGGGEERAPRVLTSRLSQHVIVNRRKEGAPRLFYGYGGKLRTVGERGSGDDFIGSLGSVMAECTRIALKSVLYTFSLSHNG